MEKLCGQVMGQAKNHQLPETVWCVSHGVRQMCSFPSIYYVFNQEISDKLQVKFFKNRKRISIYHAALTEPNVEIIFILSENQ